MKFQTDTTTEEILSDLYTIDPSLKDHENEVRKVIHALKQNQPKVSLDEVFVRRLKQDLVQMGSPRATPKTSFFELLRSYGSKLLNSRSQTVIASVFALLVAIVLPIGVILGRTQSQLPETFNLKNFSFSPSKDQDIELKPENAFGTLPLAPTSTLSSTFSNSFDVSGSSTSSAISFNDLLNSSSSSLGSFLSGSSSSTVLGILYDGDQKALTVASDTPVLRRVAGTEADTQLTALLQNMKFSLPNLSSLSNLIGASLVSAQVSEDVPFGYTISVNTNTSIVTIEKNVSRWPTTVTSPATPLSQTGAIALAKDFFSAHNIDISNYGSPIVASSTDAQNDVSVLFPLVIKDQEVYDQDGAPYGITVNVDGQIGKVASVKNITSQAFEASVYPLETDPAVILRSLGATTTPDTSTSTSDSIILHSPVHVLARYVYSDASTTKELFVPALLFGAVSTSTTALPELLPAPLVVPLVTASLR